MAGLAVVALTLAVTDHASTPLAIFDIVCGLLLIGVGIVASNRAHPPRLALIWAITGITWLAGILWPLAATWHRGPLIHGLLSYPTGRLDSWLSRAVVTAAYITGSLRWATRSSLW